MIGTDIIISVIDSVVDDDGGSSDGVSSSSSSSSFLWGVIAALIAPFLMVMGFMIWDDHWTSKNGSPFSLNMFKCNITALWFLITMILRNNIDMNDGVTYRSTIFSNVNPFENNNVKYLFVSSVVGILIGDWTWIEGLKYLGPRKVIVMDSLKPFLAAIVGRIFFNERFIHPVIAFIGLVCTVVGIALVGFENEDIDIEEHEREDDEQQHQHLLRNNDGSGDSLKNNRFDKQQQQNYNNNNSKKETSNYGIGIAISNVVLHTAGATLTKKYGIHMSTWEINFVRFGFSGLLMITISSTMRLFFTGSSSKTYEHQDQYEPIPPVAAIATTTTITTAATATATSSATQEKVESFRRSPWYKLPNLTMVSWMTVTLGVGFVSFLQPALTNYAMFQIPLALLLTLESIGPLYSLPLELMKHKTCPSMRATFGAVFAVAGIFLLSYHQSKLE